MVGKRVSFQKATVRLTLRQVPTSAYVGRRRYARRPVVKDAQDAALSRWKANIHAHGLSLDADLSAFAAGDLVRVYAPEADRQNRRGDSFDQRNDLTLDDHRDLRGDVVVHADAADQSNWNSVRNRYAFRGTADAILFDADEQNDAPIPADPLNTGRAGIHWNDRRALPMPFPDAPAVTTFDGPDPVLDRRRFRPRSTRGRVWLLQWKPRIHWSWATDRTRAPSAPGSRSRRPTARPNAWIIGRLMAPGSETRPGVGKLWVQQDNWSARSPCNGAGASRAASRSSATGRTRGDLRTFSLGTSDGWKSARSVPFDPGSPRVRVQVFSRRSTGWQGRASVTTTITAYAITSGSDDVRGDGVGPLAVRQNHRSLDDVHSLNAGDHVSRTQRRRCRRSSPPTRSAGARPCQTTGCAGTWSRR